MGYTYSVRELDRERTAKAALVSAPVSTKQAIEICNALRGRQLDRAMSLLEGVISLKRPIQFRRFNRDMGHRAGMAAGRYPVKASRHILELLKSVNSNAQEKGFATVDLMVSHISAKKASRPWRAGRHVRRKAKRTHIEVIVEQRAAREAAPKKSQEERAKRTTPKEEKPAAAEPKQVAEAEPKKQGAPRARPSPAKRGEKKND